MSYQEEPGEKSLEREETEGVHKDEDTATILKEASKEHQSKDETADILRSISKAKEDNEDTADLSSQEIGDTRKEYEERHKDEDTAKVLKGISEEQRSKDETANILRSINKANESDEDTADVSSKTVTDTLQAVSKDIQIEEEKQDKELAKNKKEKNGTQSVLSRIAAEINEKDENIDEDEYEDEGTKQERDEKDEREALSEEENKRFLRAAYHGKIKLAKQVLTSDQSVNGTDNHGWTALHWSVSRDQYDFTKFLIEREALINKTELTNGWTPLHLAAINDLPSMVSLLLEHGARKNIADRWGDTPFECTIRVFGGKKSKAGKDCRKLLKSSNFSSENEEPNGNNSVISEENYS